MERVIQKAKATKEAIAGIRPNQNETLAGAIGTNHKPANHSGPPLLKGRTEEKIRANRMQVLYGVTFTKNLVIRPIGALTIRIVQAVQLHIQMVYGVRQVTGPAIFPLLVSSPPFAYLPKEKGNDKVARATMMIGCGKVKTFQQITTLTKLLQLYTTNLLLLLLKDGGKITN